MLHIQKKADAIRQFLPAAYLAGVLICYVVNAALVVSFLQPTLSAVLGSYWAALALAIAGAGAAQFFRFLIVMTPQLLPGVTAWWEMVIVHCVAFSMAVWATAEARHLINSLQVDNSQFWALMLFAVAIIAGGYILEIMYVLKIQQFTAWQKKQGSPLQFGQLSGQALEQQNGVKIAEKS
jgi:hypothetical protein